MIFIKLLLKFKIFFFLIIILSIADRRNVFSATEPDSRCIIVQFPLPSGIIKSEIHDLKFDRNAFLYLSTYKYLWIYDGISWDNIYIENTTEIAVSDSGDVYLAAGSDLYVLQVNSRNNFMLGEVLNNQKREDAIRDLFFFHDKLILIYNDRISFLGSDNSEKVISSLNKATDIYQTDDNIFLRDENKLKRITSLFEVLDVPGIDPELSGITDHPAGYLIFHKNSPYLSVYSRDFRYLYDFNIPDQDIKAVEIAGPNTLLLLSDDNKILVTNNRGDSVETILNKNIQEDERTRMLISPNNRIWQYNENTIYIIHYFSRIRTIEIPGGMPVFDISVYHEEVLLATGEGVRSLRTGELLNIPGKTYSINSFNDLLFLRNEEGILVYSKEKKQIKKLFSQGEIRSDGFKENLLYSKSDSVFLLEHYSFSQNTFSRAFNMKLNEKYSFSYPYLYHYSRDIVELTDLENDKRIFFSFPPGFKTDPLPDMISHRKNLYLYNSKNIYMLGDTDSVFSRLQIPIPEHIIMESITPIDEFNLLGKIRSSNIPGGFFIINLKTDSIEYFTISSFPAYYSEYYVEDLNEQEFILGTAGELYKVKKTFHDSSSVFFPVIHKIIAGKDTILEGMPYKFSETNIRGKLNSISHFAGRLIIGLNSTDFSDSHIIYQYNFSGSPGWSGWKEGKEIWIDGLNPGDHSLAIRIMNSRGIISEEVTIRFRVLQAFYLSSHAMIMYAIIVLVVLFIAYKRIVLIGHRIKEPEREAVHVEAFHREEPEGYKNNNSDSKTEFAKRKAKWDKYQMVTVLFSDIQGFTKIAEQMNPEKLIDELDRFFFHFDSVVEKYDIEKIKTIGDAYMAAGGIPRKNRSNPVEVVLAALEMQQYMVHLQKTKVDFWDLRIGIHTGPVIAGVVGHKKRSYDIWGDTVNTASRMESSGEAGRVNISGETYQFVRDYFMCEYRGKLPVKYKGNLDMYFVTGLRPELSVNLAGLPNRKFFLKLQLLRLNDLEEYVFERLEEESPTTLHFHTPDYARQLYTFSELLAKAENLDVEETLMVRTATLILPLGYLTSYTTPELESSLLCQQILSQFHYSEKQIQNISNLILSSKYPPEPHNLLEKVMVDIRFEYLGRVDYIKMQKLLFLENNEYHENMEYIKWKEQQIELLQSFNYYTPGAGRLSEISFDRQIERIMKDE